VRISIVFESGARIGPGKAALLESIRDTGSISAAAREMGMSYKRASELRENAVGAAQAQSAARKIVAFAAIRDELERGGPLLTGETHDGAQSDAA
jgi:molybdenum-dependent DNA-binding transcriptional regulator ModE